MNMKLLKIFLLLIVSTSVIFHPGCAKRKKMKASKPLVAEAMKCVHQEDYSCAIEKYKEAAKENEHTDIYRLLGNAYRAKYQETFEKDYLDLEIESYEKSIALDDKNLDAFKNMGEAYFTAADYYQAKTYFQKALDLNPPEYVKNDIMYAMKECDKLLAPKPYYEEQETYVE